MSDTIAKRIQATFALVPDVKRASTEADPSVVFKSHQADVVVSTWMGARLYIYIVTNAIKVRDIKNLLRDNSRSGIGSLFLVDRNLLPSDGAITKLQDWWESLFLLHNDFFYTYYLDDDEVKITQIHFEPKNSLGDYRVWYLPEFAIEKVTVRRKEVTKGNIKGRWHTADIASPSYKRRINDQRASQRFNYHTKYTQDIPHNKKNGKGRPYTRDIQLDKYYTLIGVEKGASEKEIKRAFRQMALKVHPDVSALPRQEANERIKQLNEAYEYIKEYHGWA
ncbi:MAG: hypothetical protein Phog2KO_29940 [Phototrophicaceae bacterium]